MKFGIDSSSYISKKTDIERTGPEHWLLLALAVSDRNLQRERFQRLKVPKSSPFRPETESESNFSFHQRFQGEISKISSQFAISQMARPENQPG